MLSGALPAERLVALEGEELASEEVKDKRRLGKKMRAWNHEIEILGGGFQIFFIFTPIWGRFPF